MERTATIKLYGSIFEWNMNNARQMASQIEQASETADVIRLRIHCYGGSVIEGGMIYNAIRNSKVPVDIYIDGIAASMAAILIGAARKVYMSENAFIMVHAPAGGTDGRGTAEEHLKVAKALREMERNFVRALSARTGKPEAEVRAWMAGDNWFSATQALAAGLVDGIVDKVADGVKPLSDTEVRMAAVEDIYGLYTASLGQAGNTDKNHNNKNDMDKTKLIEAFGLAGVTADSTDEAVEAALRAKLEAERTARTNAENALKEHAKTQVAALLDSVKGRLTKEQREQYEAIGEQMGIATLENIIAPLREQPGGFSARLRQRPGGAPSTAPWDWDTWQEKDPRGLERMAKEDPDAFNALYKSAFGAEAPGA